MSQFHLTARQSEILAFIEDRRAVSGYAPTIEETASHFGFRSQNSVRQHLRLIEKKGGLYRVPGRSRALVVAKPRRPELVRVPLLGRIAAGLPVLASQNVESTLALSAQLYRGTRLFALRVRGDSMEGAGILNGDIAVLDAAAEVRNRDVAAVRIGEEATLKRFCRDGDRLVLKAENPAFLDIEIAQTDDIQVLGKLVGVMRTI